MHTGPEGPVHHPTEVATGACLPFNILRAVKWLSILFKVNLLHEKVNFRLSLTQLFLQVNGYVTILCTPNYIEAGLVFRIT